MEKWEKDVNSSGGDDSFDIDDILAEVLGDDNFDTTKFNYEEAPMTAYEDYTPQTATAVIEPKVEVRAEPRRTIEDIKPSRVRIEAQELYRPNIEIHEPDMLRPQREKAKKPIGQRGGFRAFVSIFTVLVLLIGAILGACTVLAYGPSKTARDIFVASVLETSAAKFLAHIYFDQTEIDAILAENSVSEVTAVTDTSLVNFEEPEVGEEVVPIKIEDVTGGSFKGTMMMISDPSRVFVGTSADTYTGANGLTVLEIIERYGAVAGINGGGFEDVGGVGNGGTPLGIVISEGELKYGSLYGTYEVIGIDNENKLIVGTMTGQQAIDMNIRDALTFGPALIVNGEISEMSGSGSGLNPRSAIGQTADGTILLLTCDGRQTSSLGATLSDVTDVMISYGAVNAANLDGGSSSLMYHEGEMLNALSSVYGPRNIPTAFVVAEEAN